jgi:hypothetical protein
MKKAQTLETKQTIRPQIMSRLFVHIDLADDSERGSPKIMPRVLLTVYGTVDDFRLSYPLSIGAELTVNKLPLCVQAKLIISFACLKSKSSSKRSFLYFVTSVSCCINVIKAEVPFLSPKSMVPTIFPWSRTIFS